MGKLVDKSYKNYDKLSRYSNIPYWYNLNTQKYTYGTVSWLSDDTSYENYIIQQGDTLDTLSLRAYGSPIYYWIIASFNRIRDPFEQLKVGEKIKIPTKSVIHFEEYS